MWNKKIRKMKTIFFDFLFFYDHLPNLAAKPNVIIKANIEEYNIEGEKI